MGAIEVESFGWFRGLFLLSPRPHPPMFPIIFFLLLFLKYS
jgi:hypothetical protein